MASVQERTTNQGDQTYAVLFRQGKRQTSRTFVRRKEADKFKALIDQFGADEAIRMLAPKPKAGLSLDEIAELWFTAREADVAGGDLTPRVLKGYRRDYANWISPWLGHRDAEGIRDVDVQNWIDHIRTAPKSSAKSVADRHSIMHSIYKWASHGLRGYVSHNPCVGSSLPKRHKSLPKGLRLPEFYAMLEAGREVAPDAADVVAFMGGTGWRIGEAIALTAGQVEDEGNRLYVTMGRVWRREVGFVESAKSDAGMRRMRVLGPAVGIVRRRMIGLSPGDLVFTTPRGYAWDEASFRKRYWYKIVDKAGLTERHPTPHWLRHTHVFLCHAAGMSLAEISRRIGHSDIKTTINIYGRLIDDMTDDVADRLDALLTPGAVPLVIQGRAREIED